MAGGLVALLDDVAALLGAKQPESAREGEALAVAGDLVEQHEPGKGAALPRLGHPGVAGDDVADRGHREHGKAGQVAAPALAGGEQPDRQLGRWPCRQVVVLRDEPSPERRLDG